MARKAAGFDRSLADWLEAEGFAAPASPGDIADTDRVRQILISAARERQSISYSEMLGALGHRFTRPKMRALCKTLDRIDEDAAASGEPELAILVVRESDRLPGQGWWTAAAHRHDYTGDWTGSDAARLVRAVQQATFDYWASRPG